MAEPGAQDSGRQDAIEQAQRVQSDVFTRLVDYDLSAVLPQPVSNPNDPLRDAIARLRDSADDEEGNYPFRVTLGEETFAIPSTTHDVFVDASDFPVNSVKRPAFMEISIVRVRTETDHDSFEPQIHVFGVMARMGSGGIESMHWGAVVLDANPGQPYTRNTEIESTLPADTRALSAVELFLARGIPATRIQMDGYRILPNTER